MKYKRIQVTQLTPRIGAEISGMNLASPLSRDAFDEIHHALLENLVVFFRDQRIDTNQLKAFAKLFGRLHVHPVLRLKDDPEVIEIKSDENTKQANGEFWHADVTCDPEPPMGSVLYLKTVPTNGGDTLFANMYMAYETLSPTMKEMLQGLRAVHSGNVYKDDAFYGDGAASRDYAVSEHPVVRTHPETGRKSLFVNRYFTTRIVGLSPLESKAILEMLFQHCERDDFKCRFKWRADSIAFWDNRCTQHQAIFDYYPQRRYGLRVTIAGERPA